MPRLAAAVTAAWFLVAFSGCATVGAPVLRTPPPEIPALAFARHPTVFVSDAQLGMSAQAAAFRARERELVARAGATLVEERDAGGITPLPGDLVLRYSEGEPSSASTDDHGDCLAWGAVLSVFTLGMSMIACAEPSHDRSTRTPVDVRIFDATGARVEHVVEGDERVARIDTSDRSPVLRAHYELVYEVHEPFVERMDGPTDLAFERTLGTRLAETLVVQLLPDLVRAEGLVRRDELPLAAAEERAAPTSGGEVIPGA